MDFKRQNQEEDGPDLAGCPDTFYHAAVRALFFGTPAIAVPALTALAEVAEIHGVVCQPDRPAGRGMKLTPPAVKTAGLEMGIEVYQPSKVRDGALQRWVAEKHVDVALVIAYGRILAPDVLNAPRLGCVNLHASLLPEYRGAAPIQRVLMDGREKTGVCLMQMDAGMDTGDILACHELPIANEDNAGSLAEKLGVLAADVTRIELPRLAAGELAPTPQEGGRATHAPPITREDCPLDFSKPAVTLGHRVRGLAPRPGATAQLQREGEKAKRLRIVAAHAVEGPALAPGEIALWGPRLLVGTGAGVLEIDQAQLEGKKLLAAADLVNGRTVREGDRLS